MNKYTRGYIFYGLFVCIWLAYANATGWRIINLGGGSGARWGAGGHGGGGGYGGHTIIYHK